MKAKRLLFLVMAICLASGVKAQFYDGPDDIYYYIEEYEEGPEYTIAYFGAMPHYTGRTKRETPVEDKKHGLIFNFDGTKAVSFTGGVGDYPPEIKKNIAKKASWYEDMMETTDYKIKYVSSSSETKYYYHDYRITYIFSRDRSSLRSVQKWDDTPSGQESVRVYKRINKSYFKIGRSRTPSGSLYE